MKLPCEIVRDLLPLYLEGLTSEETSRAVRAHLEACPACRALAQKPAVPQTAQDAAARLQTAQAEVHKKLWIILAAAWLFMILTAGQEWMCLFIAPLLLAAVVALCRASCRTCADRRRRRWMRAGAAAFLCLWLAVSVLHSVRLCRLMQEAPSPELTDAAAQSVEMLQHQPVEQLHTPPIVIHAFSGGCALYRAEVQTVRGIETVWCLTMYRGLGDMEVYYIQMIR